MSAGQETHRAGPWKQSNKGHKTGRHKSKGALDRENRGKVSVKVCSKKNVKVQRRVDRKHQQHQARKKARDEVVVKKRQLGGSGFPPVLVTVVPLTASQDSESLVTALANSMEDVKVVKSAAGHTHLAVPRFKQRFTLVQPRYDSLYSVLDAAKVSDTVVFLVCPHTGMDAHGELILTSVLAQGLPTSPLMVVGDMDEIPPKKHNEAKKLLLKAFEKKLPVERLYTVENSSEALLLVRALGCQKRKSSAMRERRAHMLADDVRMEPDPDCVGSGTLAVTGYVRGQPLSVNRLVHISGWGDFQLEKIETCADINSLTRDVEMGGSVLATADPHIQQQLDTENVPEPLDQEQTWPTEEELREAENNLEEKKVAKKVPKGTSEYQAAWIVDKHEEDNEGEEESDEDSDLEEDIDAVSDEEESDDEMENCDTEECETATTTGDEDYDMKHVNFAAEVDDLEKIRNARIEEMFPDEVDTPADVLARVRFQKYRGLKSFRSSPWDAKENLPSDYARIFQFENFQQTKKRVLREEVEGAEVGWYVTVYIKNVGSQFAERLAEPVVLSSLLPHEHRMSVINMAVRRSLLSHSRPVKSKERLVFHCGFRRFAACPVFSQHTNGDKHKYERFFREGDTVVMTTFAPITFPPAPVLVFQEQSSGDHSLLATGSLVSVDSDRIIVKRTVLSGHPFKVHKRMSTVRFMFFNREDIDWFKPVELRTKHGRRGHIKEPLGTHGHMKCIFDGAISQQDTVLMNLYKRVFPKWTYDPNVYHHESQVKPEFLQLRRPSSQPSLESEMDS